MNFQRILGSAKYQSAMGISIMAILNVLLQVWLFADPGMSNADKREVCQQAMYIILGAWGIATSWNGIEDVASKVRTGASTKLPLAKPPTNGPAAVVNIDATTKTPPSSGRTHRVDIERIPQ
ncbi:MAG TPA: hypothetical protein VGN72_14520 [Tepidisphaeraceae bacterium]|jgi:hypothetical protein|nr:hypothetical protein [Tepidisphaeraceae bacterium]